MNKLLALPSTALQSILWPKQHQLLKKILLVLSSAFVLGIAAQISIPLQPVPLTFQSVTVLLIGMILGARLGSATIITYLVLGCCGLPLFANFSGGLHVMVGPTAGYLIGFVPAALICGYLAQCGWAKSYFTTFFAAIIGTFIIFICGVFILAQFIGWQHAYLFGVKPFLMSETLKLLVLTAVVPRFWKSTTL